MAEERMPDAMDQELPGADDAPATPAPALSRPKKKKKRGKFTTFLWLILMGLGGAVGLHLSGFWDGRPLFWGIVPNIPYVGAPLAEFFKIPEQYSLTVSERRALELAEWQRRLDERERSLASRDVALETLSGDLGARMQDVTRREELLVAAAENPAGQDGPTPSEQELMNQVARTYQDMSARNAAAVVEQLRDRLAVELLMKLPNDARASIMGKLKPQKAARLTELMTRPHK